MLAHLEEGPFGVETAKKNMPDLGVLYPESNWGPVTDYARDQFDLLYGNPPCASWSQAGVKVRDKEDRNEARWSKDGRTDCTVRLFALLEKLRPKIFLWESVAAAMKNGAAFVQQRVEQVNKLGYHAWLITFNGADCGLPQRRKRFFFLASKVKVDVEGPPGGGIVTVREALASIPAGSSQEGAVPSDNYLRILWRNVSQRDLRAVERWEGIREERAWHGGWQAWLSQHQIADGRAVAHDHRRSSVLPPDTP